MPAWQKSRCLATTCLNIYKKRKGESDDAVLSLIYNNIMSNITVASNKSMPVNLKPTYYATHTEQCKAAHTAYRATHKKEHAAYNAVYRASHKADIKAYDASYYVAHKEERAAYAAVYKKAHVGEREQCEYCTKTYVSGHRSDHWKVCMKHCCDSLNLIDL